MDLPTKEFYLEAITKRLQKLNEALDQRDRFLATNLLAILESDCLHLHRVALVQKDESLKDAADDIWQNIKAIQRKLNRSESPTMMVSAWKEPMKERIQRLFGTNPLIMKSIIALQSLCFQLQSSIFEQTHAESKEHAEELEQAAVMLRELAQETSNKKALSLSQDIERKVQLLKKKIEMRAAYTIVNDILVDIERRYPKLKRRKLEVKGEVAQPRQVM